MFQHLNLRGEGALHFRDFANPSSKLQNLTRAPERATEVPAAKVDGS